MKSKAKYLQEQVDKASGAAKLKVADKMTAHRDRRLNTPKLKKLKEKAVSLQKQAHETDRVYQKEMQKVWTKMNHEKMSAPYYAEYARIDALVSEVEGRILFSKDYDAVMKLIATIK